MALPNRAIPALKSLVKPSQVRSYSAPVSGIPPSKQKYIPTTGTYPKGFLVSGTHVGVKPSNKAHPDLAFLASEAPCAAAAVFTKNKFQAAPVTVSRNMLKRRNNENIRGVIINSGCANAVTGKGGIEDAESMVQVADSQFGASNDGLGGSSIVMSTGVIGQRLPIQKILDGIPKAKEALGNTHEHWMATARAICTTDTFPKLMSRSFRLPGSDVEYRIAGMTKGAGMLHPNMATLLGIVCTDAPIASNLLYPLLKSAVDDSFNSISVDGDTSTNDTIALLANGAAGGSVISSADSPAYKELETILKPFFTELAQLIVRDGEGATKFVTIRVTSAASVESARHIASTIARSPLVKTALYGKDANWGRILCATGYSLISPQTAPINEVEEINPETTSVSFVPVDGSAELKLLVNGEPEQVDEERASEILKSEDLEVLVQLGTGTAETKFWTCDFSHEYVTINGDYRT